MRHKLSLVLVLCLVAVLVQSETEIEVDENGDEYEVKRFTIQGRTLGEGRSQCVVTRRKRSTSDKTNAAPKQAAYASDEKSEEDEERKQPIPVIFTGTATPVTGVNIATSVDDGDGQGQDQDQGDGDQDGDEDEDDQQAQLEPLGIVQIQPVDNGEDDADAGDDGGEDGNLGNENLNIPTGGEDATGGENVAHIAIATSANVGTTPPATAPPSTNGALAVENAPAVPFLNNNGLVVVHTNGNNLPIPVEVNEKGEVVQLLPVAPDNNNGVGVYVGDGEKLHYEEEISPVTTTAIWSTGDDDDDDLDLYSNHKLKPGRPGKKPLKGSKGKKKKKKKKNKNQLKKKKNKRRNKNRRNKNKNKKNKNKKKKNKNKNKKKKNRRRRNKNKNKNKRNKNKHRRPGNKNRRPLSNKRRRENNTNKRRRLPQRGYDMEPIYQQGNRVNSNRRQNNVYSHNQNGNRQFNTNSGQLHKKRRNNSNRNKVDQGANSYTKTQTTTQTGGPDDNKNVNCIYIRKEPSTTPRPFWNVFGRDAGANANEEARSGHFGKRKRVNMRFVA